MARTLSMFGGDGCQDLHLDSRGNLAVASDLEDVRQRVVERLRFHSGQWYLDTQGGVPYRQEIFTRPVSAGLAAALITDQISQVAGVEAVRDVVATINASERRLTYRATVNTPFGEMQING